MPETQRIVFEMYVPRMTMWDTEMSESPSRNWRTPAGVSDSSPLVDPRLAPVAIVSLTPGSQGSTVEPSMGVQGAISCVRYSGVAAEYAALCDATSCLKRSRDVWKGLQAARIASMENRKKYLVTISNSGFKL